MQGGWGRALGCANSVRRSTDRLDLVVVVVIGGVDGVGVGDLDVVGDAVVFEKTLS